MLRAVSEARPREIRKLPRPAPLDLRIEPVHIRIRKSTLEPLPCECFAEHLVVGSGLPRRSGHGVRPLSGFVMVLSYSRAVFARFTVDQTLESFLRGHVDAFARVNGLNLNWAVTMNPHLFFR